MKSDYYIPFGLAVFALGSGVQPAKGANLYWRTDGATGQSWTGANWGTSASGPFTAAWVDQSNSVFSANSNLTFATTDIGNVSVDPGVTVTVVSGGTFGTNGQVRTVTVGAGAFLDWQTQTISSAGGEATMGFVKNGAGTWNMHATGRDYSGGFTLNEGTVVVTGNSVFGAAVMTINGGTIESSDSKTFTPSSLVVGGDFTLAGTGNDTWNMPVNLNGGIRTITQNAGGADRVFSNVISNGGLTKAGTAVLTLSGNNSYTGKTTVSQGTLKLTGSGSIATSSEISIASGATLDVSGVTGGWSVASGQKLGGSGTVQGATTINGTHAPGTAGTVGLQTVTGSLAYGNNSIFEWDLNANSTASGFDTVTASGNISVGTTGTIFKVIFGNGVGFSDPFWSTPYITRTWSMESIFGKAFSSGSFQTVQTSTDVSSYGSFTINGTGLTWTAVPEPTTALAGLLLGAGILRRSRRRVMVSNREVC